MITALGGRATFDSVVTGTEMLFDASTRASRRMRHNEDDFLEIYDQLFTTQGTVPGKPPETVPIYASTFKLVNGRCVCWSILVYFWSISDLSLIYFCMLDCPADAATSVLLALARGGWTTRRSITSISLHSAKRGTRA